jgi:hypothetical protein
MRFAYADPPYPGNAARHYRDHEDYAGEVDYAELIGELERDFPDGWALSCGSQDLRDVLPMCPPDEWPRARTNKWPRRRPGVRVCAWTKPFSPMKPRVSVQYGWEPLILRRGRPRSIHDGVLNDWCASSPINPRGGGVIGAKPEAFCWWVFRMLGARAGDELVDLFPGSGAVAAAWERYVSQIPFHFPGPGDGTAPEELAV